MKPHQDAVIRLAEVPGLGIDSAQQVIAQFFANVRDTAVAGFFFLLPAYVVIIVATKA